MTGSTTHAADDPRPRRREQLVVTAVTSTMVLLVLDSSIVGVMLPTITRDLDLDVAQSSWLVSVYLLMLAVFAPVGGRLADARGAVTMFRVGMIGFTVASLIIALVPSFAGVIIGRAVAGVAGAVLMPASLSLIMQAVDETRRSGAMAVYTGVGQGFALIGPALGGVCAQFLTWQVGFLINVPVGVAALVLVSMARPRTRPPTRQSWDGAGIVLVVAGMGAVVTALLQGPAWGWSSPAVLALLAGGSAALAAFVWDSRRSVDPVLDLALLREAPFAVGTGLLAALGFSMTVATIYGAVALQQAMHLQPFESGIALLPLVVPLLIATRLVGARYERYGLRRVTVAGCACMAGGMAVAGLGFAHSSVLVVTIGLCPIGVGIGTLLSPLTAATLAAVVPDRRGQASGLITTGRQLGGIVGVAVFAAVLAGHPDDTGTAVGFFITAGLMLLAGAVAATHSRQRPVR
ncbi:MFS transporter [Gordonia sp. 'Campus']|uniref:MFS transporter n=1 Tax=Gordonia sp. 'Campus' TaxID=2915824 RepID=UPI001EE46FFB|nr:MFS transporter [Gordonia sp. 'Campus']